MSCKFCGNPPCGNEWCPYSDPALNELRKLVKAQENVPFKFDQKDKDAFTAELLQEMKDEK